MCNESATLVLIRLINLLPDRFLYVMQNNAVLLESCIIEISNFSKLLSLGPSPVLELKAFDSALR